MLFFAMHPADDLAFFTNAHASLSAGKGRSLLPTKKLWRPTSGSTEVAIYKMYKGFWLYHFCFARPSCVPAFTLKGCCTSRAAWWASWRWPRTTDELSESSGGGGVGILKQSRKCCHSWIQSEFTHPHNHNITIPQRFSVTLLKLIQCVRSLATQHICKLKKVDMYRHCRAVWGNKTVHSKIQNINSLNTEIAIYLFWANFDQACSFFYIVFFIIYSIYFYF